MLKQNFKNDAEALLQMSDGNVAAYRFLFDHHFTDLCNFLLIYLHSKELSEEIALEIFTFIWEKRQSLQIKASFKSFLFSSAKNRAISLYRKEQKKMFTTIDFGQSVFNDDSSSQQLFVVSRNTRSRPPTRSATSPFSRFATDHLTRPSW
jgi:RNA polymerase sigma-70 factor (ECF subfamily)